MITTDVFLFLVGFIFFSTCVLAQGMSIAHPQISVLMVFNQEFCPNLTEFHTIMKAFRVDVILHIVVRKFCVGEGLFILTSEYMVVGYC